jgi:LCP family protein required for cell wall assembly
MREPKVERPLPSAYWIILGALFVLFLLGGLFSAYVFFYNVADFLTHQPRTLQNLPIVGRPSSRPNAPNWENLDRVNFLLLGLDKRLSEIGPARSDTIIIATVDPRTRSAGMLSIPRDLYVEIPDAGMERINMAYFLGEVDKKRYGSGAELARHTIEYQFGVPIHYYVVIDFEGFKKVVDALGGITINVEKPIRDDSYPDENYGYKPIFIPAGVQHMDGETALEYARTRHGVSDFERAKRQQQVLIAIGKQALSLNLLPRLPQLIQSMGNVVQTDLTPAEIVTLAQIGSQIDPDSLKSRTLSYNEVKPMRTEKDADVLWFDREKVGKLLEDVFTPTTVAVVLSPELKAKLDEEAARIVVQNGTPKDGVAEQAGIFLEQRGYQIVELGNADRRDYAQTILIDYTGKTYTLNSLAQLLHVAPENVRTNPKSNSDADIRIILGADYVPSNP